MIASVHRWLLLLAACSSSSSSSTAPTNPTPVASLPDAAGVVVDAPADAPGATDGALATAPQYVFRYNAPPRVETWTLRIAGDRASIVVKAANEMLYTGTFVDGKLDVATSTAKLALACTRGKLDNVGEPDAVQKKGKRGCAFAKTSGVEAWLCKHPDFEAPMPFAAAPGVEFAITGGECKDGAYRRLP